MCVHPSYTQQYTVYYYTVYIQYTVLQVRDILQVRNIILIIQFMFDKLFYHIFCPHKINFTYYVTFFPF